VGLAVAWLSLPCFVAWRREEALLWLHALAVWMARWLWREAHCGRRRHPATF